MVIKVGINGFGRIGRVIFRTCHQNPDLEVTAINDPAIDVEYICYLIKFDSTHGKFRGIVTHFQNEITVDENKIKIFHEKLPSNVPWQSADVQYVVEASGIFTSYQKASGHLSSKGVKRVIVTAPSADVTMVILGVNEADLHIDKKVISSASSTLYCLTPIVKILNDNFGVSEGFLTSIHAMTPSLKPLDGLCLRGKHWRDHRSIHQNIIPAATGACKALGKIIPQMKDRLGGLAFRVPIVNVSVLDLTLRLNKETSIEEITKCVEAYSKSTMANIIKTTNEDAVSSDFVGDKYSCILDVNSSLQLKKNFFKLVCWYENEYSYACRVIDLIFFSEKQFQLADPRNKMTFVRTRATKKVDNKDEEIRSSNDPSIKTSQISLSNSQIKLLRSPARPTTLTKPLSPNNSVNPQEMNKSDAVFRIWNDDEMKKQPIKKSNYHSSDEISHQNQSNNLKAHQRLENVNKEFSKMVSITEKLLQKCSKIRESNYIDIAEEIPNAELKDGAHIRKSFEDNAAKESLSRMNKTSLISNVSGDNISNFEERNSSKNEYSTDTLSDCNRNSSVCIGTKYQSCSTLTYSNCNSTNDVQASDSVTQAHGTKNQMVDDLFQNQVVKTINNLIEGLTRSIDIKVGSDYKTNQSEAKENEDTEQAMLRINSNKESLETKIDSGFVSPLKDNISPDSCSFDNTITKLSLDDKSAVEVKLIEIKGNTVFDNDGSTQFVSHVDRSQKENTPVELKTLNIDCCKAKTISNPAEILNSLNKFFDPLIILPDNDSKCESSLLTASINSDTGRKVDLYDKLDSVSGSDSENSFQINERKSQVIKLSDLTNSIEDLVRLDKICRIIEISDELSDDLFSALGSSESTAIQKTKWSFKDLCKRIKLDEFCNSLFAAQSCHYGQKK